MNSEPVPHPPGWLEPEDDHLCFEAKDDAYSCDDGDIRLKNGEIIGICSCLCHGTKNI